MRLKAIATSALLMAVAPTLAGCGSQAQYDRNQDALTTQLNAGATKRAEDARRNLATPPAPARGTPSP